MAWRAFAVIASTALMAAVASGCGGSSSSASGPAVTTYAVQTVETPATATPRHCNGLTKAKQAVQRRKLERDLRALRAAAVTMKHFAQDGNPQMNKAVDRFEIDVADEALSRFQRNRFIDRAAAIVGPRCYLCFQALEANRPLAAGAKLACG
jgi:hypothetical protein